MNLVFFSLPSITPEFYNSLTLRYLYYTLIIRLWSLGVEQNIFESFGVRWE